VGRYYCHPKFLLIKTLLISYNILGPFIAHLQTSFIDNLAVIKTRKKTIKIDFDCFSLYPSNFEELSNNSHTLKHVEIVLKDMAYIEL